MVNWKVAPIDEAYMISKYTVAYDVALSLTLIAKMYLSNVSYELIDSPVSTIFNQFLWSLVSSCNIFNFPLLYSRIVFSSCLMGDEISSS